MPTAGPRIDLGISLDDAAQAIGISRGTLTLYEVNPATVGEERRNRIASFYRDLREVHERARARHARKT